MRWKKSFEIFCKRGFYVSQPLATREKNIKINIGFAAHEEYDLR